MSAKSSVSNGQRSRTERGNRQNRSQAMHKGRRQNQGLKKSNGGSVTKSVQLLIQPQPTWHAGDILNTLPDYEDKELSGEDKAALLKNAMSLLESETEKYTATSEISSSQKQFFSEIMNAGTLSDRISALTLLIQESPLHATRSLTSLLTLAKKKNRTLSLQAVEALKDLFTNGNVLPDRKLVWFTHQNSKSLSLLAAVAFQTDDNIDGKTATLTRQWMMIFAFEDWLKQFYFTFVQILETLSHDSVVHVRSSILSDIMDLMRDKPEQEVNLLRLGVNKLGDADRRTASKASHLILGLEQAHPAMKRVIVNAVAELVFRPNSDYHARYYSMITLNQTIVTNRDKELANTLIGIYFTLFERLMAESKNLKDEAMAEKKVKKKGRWKSNKKAQQASPKAVQLSGQKSKSSPEALEEANMRLVSAILTGLNRAFPYASLEEDVFKSHLSVIYHVARSGNFNTCVQALMLLHQISSANQVLSDRFYRTLYESLLDPRVIKSSKQALYLNLVFKALKNDVNPERVKAFAKRMMQVATETENVGFCAGVIYLLSEVEKAAPYIRTLVTDPPDTGDSDHEEFKDVPDEGDGTIRESKPSANHISAPQYDGKTHDPMHANASATCLWELLPLTRHYHPTITHFATRYLAHKDIESRPDLALHTLTHFLDRFVYKSPKAKLGKTNGAGSIMQPMTGSNAYASKDVLLLSTKAARQSVPSANSVDWKQVLLEKSKEKSAPDEQFFARYFVNKGLAPKGVKKEEKDITDESTDVEIEDDVDQGSEELDEDEVWKAMVSSRKELEGADESDDSMDDIAVSYDSDDSGSEGDIGTDIDESEVVDGDDKSDETAEFDDSDDEIDGDKGLDDDETELAEIFAAENAKNEDLSSQQLRKSKSKRKIDSGNDYTSDSKTKGKRRRQLKELPIFASADDYKDLLSGSDSD
ncbi:CBF/Mak21 family-domain-containing protein [Lipomyces kononenkoae]|uniref:CBF/Mak21 family-domain-containing protein n=1 Tax=Lipomyces kononenkoae TaxID=34357 RepID=A0ACC3T0W7_LIPKO